MIERPNVCRIEWLTISGERLAGVAGLVLADPVEDDDRVVDAEADDGQHRGHEQRVDLDAEERAEDREDADDDDDVVEQRDERRHAELDVAEAVGDPGRIPSEPTRMRMRAWLIRSELTTGADGRQAGLLGDRAELVLERRRDLAELALRRQVRVADGAGGRRRGRRRAPADGAGVAGAAPGWRRGAGVGGAARAGAPLGPAAAAARRRPGRRRRRRRGRRRRPDRLGLDLDEARRRS